MASSLFEVKVTSADLDQLPLFFEEGGRRMKRKVNKFVGSMTRQMYGNVIKHASGRPGPNIVTGEYLNSIRQEVKRGGFKLFGGPSQVTGRVWTDAPQASRLEHGFVGTDSLGRNYTQPPFPHWRPAQEETLAWAEANIGSVFE